MNIIKKEAKLMTKNSNIILKIQNLNFSYSKNEEFALKDINLEFEKGKIYAILGQNGSGKSTLLSCISSINTNYSGKISVDGKTLSNIKQNERAKLISLVPQNSIANSLTVYDTVMLGRKPYINISAMMVDHEMTSRAIDTFNLCELSLKSTNELSGGEFQTTNIARAFAQNAPIMLLDEPTNNLDIKKQYNLFNIIKDEIKSKNKTVICVLHDINHAMKYANELIFMKNGEVIKNGTRNIVSESLLNMVYDVKAEIINNKKSKYIII